MKRRYVLVPLLSLIILSHLTDKQQTPVERLRVPVDTNELPDYYMEKLSIRMFDDEGRLKATIESPSLVHYANQGQARIDTPSIRLFGVNARIWQIDAMQGRILDDTQDIALEQNVKIELGKPDSTGLQLNTEQLYYEFAAHRAWNQQEVTFNKASSAGRARGLLIDMNTERFELHHNVEVSYRH